MVHREESPAVDLYAVLADDRMVEMLGAGRIPAHPTLLVRMLADWRDLCRDTNHPHAA